MATFPELEPTTRAYDFGQFPLTDEPTASAGTIRFKHSETSENYKLTLGYIGLTDAQANLIRAHYQAQNGSYRSFQLPSAVWKGHTFTGNVVPYTARWRYIETPEEEHFSIGYVNVTVTLGSDGTNEDAVITSAVIINFAAGEGRSTDSANSGCTLAVTTSLVAGVPYGDVIFDVDGLINKVTTLLHFNGTNGSTVKTDNSFYANTVVDDSPGADSIISTAQSKYGGASLYMDGTTSLIIDNPAISIGPTENHTVEFWFYPTSATVGDRAILSLRDNDVNAPSINLIASPSASYTTITLLVCGSITAKYFARTFAGDPALLISTNNWGHIAYSRIGTSFTLFINGNRISTISNTFPVSVGRVLRIGAATKVYQASPPTLPLVVENLSPALGYLDDLRITKGVARYFPNPNFIASFTPPLAQHPDPPA